MNRTVVSHALLALALAAAFDAAGQPGRPAGASSDAPATEAQASAPGVATLNIDTRDTGVDLGLNRRVDAGPRGSATASRRAPLETGTAGDAAAAAAGTSLQSLGGEAVDRRMPSSVAASPAPRLRGDGITSVDIGTLPRDLPTGTAGRAPAPMAPRTSRSIDAATAADAAARSRGANHTEVSGRIVPAPRTIASGSAGTGAATGVR